MSIINILKFLAGILFNVAVVKLMPLFALDETGVLVISIFSIMIGYGFYVSALSSSLFDAGAEDLSSSIPAVIVFFGIAQVLSICDVEIFTVWILNIAGLVLVGIELFLNSEEVIYLIKGLFEGVTYIYQNSGA